MIVVRRLRSGELELLKQLRLESLRDAPDAFGRTLAETLAQPEAYWTDMERSITEPGLAFGIRKTNVTADLAGMWVDPRARGAGTSLTIAEMQLALAKAPAVR